MKKIILVVIVVFISLSTIAQNTFSISSESVEVGDNFTLDIDLANSIEVTAFQFDLSHNENAYELTSGSALNTRAENHTLSVGRSFCRSLGRSICLTVCMSVGRSVRLLDCLSN